MAITFGSDRFTVTGGYVDTTATGGTANTIQATGAFTGMTDADLANRVVWIHAGTGAGQYRNITVRNSDNEVEVDDDWDTQPDATSQFLIGFNPEDLAAVSAVGCNIIVTGDINVDADLSGIGYVANITAHIDVGNNSDAIAFLHFPKGSYNFDEPITSSDASHPWSSNSQIIRTYENTTLQFGNLRESVDVGFNGCMVTVNNEEHSWDRRLINTGITASSVIRIFGSTFHSLCRTNPDGGSARAFITIQLTGACTAKIRDCYFGEGGSNRFFSSNLDIKNTKVVNGDIPMTQAATPPADLTLVGPMPISYSTNSDDNGTPQRKERITIRSYGHVPAEASSESAEAQGDIAAPKTGNSNGELVDFTYNARIGHSSPPNASFDSTGDLREIYTFGATIQDSAQSPIQNALVSLRATAGNCTIDGIQTDALTAADGTTGIQEVTTRYADADGGTNRGWTSGVLPYWRMWSKYNYRLRVRAEGKIFLSTPASFSDPDTAAGQALRVSLGLLDDTHETADGSTVTGVSITDNRSAPVSWQGTLWGWTIVGNLTTNPSLTAQDIYNWWKYHGRQNTNLPGTTVHAAEAHELLLLPSETQRGSYYDPNDGSHSGGGTIVDGSTSEFGVRIVDENGNPFPGVDKMVADDGSEYNAPEDTDVTILLNPATTAVAVIDDGGTTQFYSASETGSFNYSIPEAATGSWTFVTKAAGYEPAIISKTANGVAGEFSAVTDLDRQPDGSLMYQSTSSALLAVGPLSDGSRMNFDIGDGAVSAQAIYDEMEDALLTQTGLEYLANGGGRATIAVLPGGNHLFMETNVRIRRATAGDANAQVDAFVLSTDNVVVDGVNGGVLFLSVTDADKVSTHQSAVWLDTGSANSGTNFPVGTQLKPVNNLTDALDIAVGLGLVQINLLSDLAITTNVQNYLVRGLAGLPTVSLVAGNIDGSTFQGVRLTGAQTGSVRLFNCTVDGLTGANFEATESVIDTGGVTVADGGTLLLLDCASAVPGTVKPWISLAGATGVGLMLRNWAGGVELRSSTDAGNSISFDLIAGSPEFASSCTAGTVVLRGRGNPPVDNSAGLSVTDSGYNAVELDPTTVWGDTAEGTNTYGDVMRLMASVLAGKSTVVDNGDGTVSVVFNDLPDTKARVSATLDQASQRTSVVLDAT